MQETSEKYDLVVKSDNARYFSIVKHNGITLNIEVQDFKYEGLINTDEDISIGNTCSSMVSFSLYKPEISLENKEIEIRYGLMIDSKLESIRIGYFTIQTQESDGEVTKFTGYDRMGTRFEKAYFSDLSYPNNTKNIVNEILQKTNVSIEEELTKSYTIKKKPSGYTLREIIGYIAALYGKNAIINRNGKLEFKWYKKENYTIDASRYYEDGIEISSETDFIVNKISCTVKDGESESKTLEEGVGITGIYIENPFMTESILKEIYKSISGFQFRPMSVRFLGDFKIDLGDVISVKIDNHIYEIPVMQIQQECDGGLITKITSIAKSESEQEIDKNGPNKREMDRYYAELVIINEAMINKLDVETAKITYATIKNLEATNAEIENLKANTITTEYLNANYANIQLGNIHTADVAKLFANVGLIDSAVIENGHITGYLSSVKINADVIEAGTLSVDRLLITGEDSIVYQINVNSSGLSKEELTKDVYKKYLNGTDIVANSITANQIAAGTITAKEILTKSITIGCISDSAIESINSGVVKDIEDVSSYVSILEQNFDGFKTIVSETYTTKEAFEALEIGATNLLTGTKNEATKRVMGSYYTNYKNIKIEDIGLVAGEDYVTFSAVFGTAGENFFDNISVRITQVNSENSTISNSFGNFVKNNVGGFSSVSVKLDKNCNSIMLMFGRENGGTSAQTFNFSSKKEKLERGNKATDWSPSPKDIESEINVISTSYQQLSDKFSWIVKSGTSESNMTLTDSMYELISNNIILTAEHIDLNGIVTANGGFSILKDGSFNAEIGRIAGFIVGGNAIYDTNLNLQITPGNIICQGDSTNLETKITGGSITCTCEIPSTTDLGLKRPISVLLKQGSTTTRCFDISIVKSGGTIIKGMTMNGSISCQDLKISTTSYPSLKGNDSVLCLSVDSSTNGSIRLKKDSNNYGIFAPTFNGNSTTSGQFGCYLGDSSHKWKDIYSVNSVIQTSDKNEKNDINTLDKKMIDFVLKLNPVSFKFKNGESGRTHYGLIAQDVEEVLTDLKMTSNDFAGFIKTPKIKEIEENTVNDEGEIVTKIIYEKIPNEYTYGLRYEEFIAPMIKTIQCQQEKIELLEDSIKELKEIVKNFL